LPVPAAAAALATVNASPCRRRRWIEVASSTRPRARRQRRVGGSAAAMAVDADGPLMIGIISSAAAACVHGRRHTGSNSRECMHMPRGFATLRSFFSTKAKM